MELKNIKIDTVNYRYELNKALLNGYKIVKIKHGYIYLLKVVNNE